MENISGLEEVLKDEPTDVRAEEDVFLEPLLEEIQLINSESIANFVRSVLLRSGDFWFIPVYPEKDLFPPDEYEPGGNIIHTKRVVRAIRLLCYINSLDTKRTDIAIAAALLHTVTKAKYSDESETVEYDLMYPYTVKVLIDVIMRDDEIYSTDDRSTTLDADTEDIQMILMLIRKQMGAHSLIPEVIPQPFSYESILNTAVVIAMNLHILIDGDEINQDRWGLAKVDE